MTLFSPTMYMDTETVHGCKLLRIKHKIAAIQRAVKELEVLIVEADDSLYVQEFAVISNCILSLENIRVSKLLHLEK